MPPSMPAQNSAKLKILLAICIIVILGIILGYFFTHTKNSAPISTVTTEPISPTTQNVSESKPVEDHPSGKMILFTNSDLDFSVRIPSQWRNKSEISSNFSQIYFIGDTDAEIQIVPTSETIEERKAAHIKESHSSPNGDLAIGNIEDTSIDGQKAVSYDSVS